MRRRSDVRGEEHAEEPIKVPVDSVNEQMVIAAAMADEGARKMLCQRLRPEHFQVEELRPVWAAIQDLTQKALTFDLATLQSIGGGKLNIERLANIAEVRPDPIPEANLQHHLSAMAWDRQRASCARGPLSLLLEALKDPTQAPERVRALGRAVAESFEAAGDNYLNDPKELIRTKLEDLRKRSEGHACFPYGVDGLDVYEEGAKNAKGEDISGRYRILPGAQPGMTTVITAVSGGGKSTFAARVTLGLQAQGRRVLYAAWEPGSGMTLELLATMALGFNRTDIMEGRYGREELIELEEKMHELAKRVVFMENPFARQLRGGRPSNDRNLDVVHQHVVDSGCEVAIFDLWERCLVDQDEAEEKRALWRQHAIAEETRTHNILLAQQRLKDIEKRNDPRPTREGIKGSSAWVDIGETIIAPHRPALFKKVPDDKMELLILKQRWGGWPLAVECNWDAEYGSIEKGRSIPFEHIGDQASQLAEFVAPNRDGKRKPRKPRA